MRDDSTGDDFTFTTLHRRALLGSIGAVGTTFLAGCGAGGDVTETPGGTGGDDDTDTTPANPAATRYVSSLRNDPATLDPHTAESTSDVAYMAFPPNAYETLVFFAGGSSELEPVLATEIPTVDNGLLSEDGTEIEFPLREGVTFHTGGEMVAEDVEFSLTRASTMGLSDELNKADQIESVEVVDDYRVRITLRQTTPDFFNGTISRPIMSIMSKQAVEENGGVVEGQPNEWVAQNTAGTGPFVLDTWQRGENMQFDFHSDYWDPDSVNPKGGAILHIIPETSTMAAVLGRGEIHSTSVATAEVDAFENLDNVDLHFYDTLDPEHFAFNYDIPFDHPEAPEDNTIPSDFFRDKNVRKGFMYAIDYDAYVQEVWNGRSSIPNIYHMPTLQFYNPDAPKPHQDLELAEEHFREAGVWEEGFTVTTVCENIPQFELTQLFIKDQLESLNDRFTINTRTMPEAVYDELVAESPMPFPLTVNGYLEIGPDPAPYYNEWALPGGSYERSWTGDNIDLVDVVDPRIAENIREAGSIMDPERRRELYYEVQELCFEEVPVIPISVEQGLHVSRSCVDPIVSGVYSGTPIKDQDISECGDLPVQA